MIVLRGQDLVRHGNRLDGGNVTGGTGTQTQSTHESFVRLESGILRHDDNLAGQLAVMRGDHFPSSMTAGNPLFVPNGRGVTPGDGLECGGETQGGGIDLEAFHFAQ